MTSCFNIQSATVDWVNRCREPCLNLLSQRWLNPRRDLVTCLIPLLLKKLYVLLAEDLINYRILFLKVLRLFELRRDISRLFHSIIRDGKKIFLKKLCLK